MSRRTYTDEEFVKAVESSKSWAGVLRNLSLKPGGGTYVFIKQLANQLSLSTDHMTGKGWNVGDRFSPPRKKRDLRDILVKDSTYQSTDSLRRRLLSEGIKERKCELCKKMKWMGKPIPLQLDHINGIRTDHRLENLRILCPNCHAQTDTYCGKNKGNKSV